jgi:hypothetical protein
MITAKKNTGSIVLFLISMTIIAAPIANAMQDSEMSPRALKWPDSNQVIEWPAPVGTNHSDSTTKIFTGIPLSQSGHQMQTNMQSSFWGATTATPMPYTSSLPTQKPTTSYNPRKSTNNIATAILTAAANSRLISTQKLARGTIAPMTTLPTPSTSSLQPSAASAVIIAITEGRFSTPTARENHLYSATGSTFTYSPETIDPNCQACLQEEQLRRQTLSRQIQNVRMSTATHNDINNNGKRTRSHNAIEKECAVTCCGLQYKTAGNLQRHITRYHQKNVITLKQQSTTTNSFITPICPTPMRTLQPITAALFTNIRPQQPLILRTPAQK